MSRGPFVPTPDYLPEEVRRLFEALNIQAATFMQTLDRAVGLRTADAETRAYRDSARAHLRHAVWNARAAIDCEASNEGRE